MSDEPVTNRVARLAVGAILLWLTASIAASSLMGVVEADPVAALLVWPLAACSALVVAGIQTVLYSLLMEFCVWRLVGRNVLAILVSSFLGLTCGLSIVVLGARDFWAPVLFAGFSAGLTTGFVLYLMKKERPSKQPPPNPPE